MSDEQAGKFLKEIKALYPKFLSDDKNIDIGYNLWFEMLQEVKYEEAHQALIEYYKRDMTGYPPTFGQLFPPDDHSEPTYIRDESIEDWN